VVNVGIISYNDKYIQIVTSPYELTYINVIIGFFNLGSVFSHAGNPGSNLGGIAKKI